MTVREMMLKLLADAEAENDSPDIDFCDDYDEGALCAYCGNHWSEAAEERFSTAFNLPIDMEYTRLDGDYPIVIVHCENWKERKALAELLYAMAGYISEEAYEKYFPEPDEPEPVRNMVEIVLTTGAVLKATRIEFNNADHKVPAIEAEVDGEWQIVPMFEIVRIIGEVK